MIEAPKSTGKPPQEIVLTGCLIPWGRGQPVLAHIMGLPSVFHLMVFSEEEKLKSFMSQAGIPFESVKQIDDGTEFLSSIPDDIVIIQNPRFTSEGKIRYLQVFR